MEVEIVKYKGRWRFVDSTTGVLARATNGSLLDKGGFITRQEADAALRQEKSKQKGLGGFNMNRTFRGGKL